MLLAYIFPTTAPDIATDLQRIDPNTLPLFVIVTESVDLPNPDWHLPDQ